MNPTSFGLYDPARESSDCGVGFITRLDGTPHHDVIRKGDEALCAIPHRGGKSAEGVGDGAGVSIDLSVEFFSAITGQELRAGHFGVANCFVPSGTGAAADAERARAQRTVTDAIETEGFELLVVRDVPVDHSVARPEAEQYQLPIVQWVFRAPEQWDRTEVDAAANRALLAIESVSYGEAAEQRAEHAALYPLSLSARTQILKGRLNSGEVIGYFTDLRDPRHSVRTLYFHTRFSTNTEPHPTMAQPFRLMAHNGELNTDRKNRLSDEALARARTRSIVRPPGQSDSSRLDQTLQSRVFDDGLEIVEAVVSLMPPAWENDRTLTADVRDMLEYFSLYEEKNDGPAAVIFSDGDVVGARLDRLGLRPLRTVETTEYLMVSSEAGQVTFDADEVVHRGRIEAGGMLVVDHRTGTRMRTDEVLRMLAARRDYGSLLDAARVDLDDLPAPDYERTTTTLGYEGDLSLAGRYVAYSLNQESFRFMLDPMLQNGSERISAMGYGNAINALSDTEGGMAKYFSQRFAQVTNPPLDSIREADGMSMRVALGAKPDGTGSTSRQLVVQSPILGHLDMVRLRDQDIVPLERFDMLYVPVLGDEQANADAVRDAVDALCDAVEQFAGTSGGIAVLTDREVSSTRAPLPVILAVAAVNQRLIETGLRLRVSVVAESGQLPSSHHVATALGFGASAVYSLSARLRAEEKYPAAPAPAGELTATDLALKQFRKAAEKALAKTMGRVGLCTAESYIGGAFFEPNYLDTGDDVLARVFPHMQAPVGGVGFARIAQAATDWHERARSVAAEGQVPLLGLFKERSDGAGHSFGVASVRGFGGMTEERPSFERSGDSDALRLLTLGQLDDSFGITDAAYRNTGYDRLSDTEIDQHRITPGYVTFLQTTHDERSRRPAALRDVLALPADVTGIDTAEDFARELGRFSTTGNASVTVRGLSGSRPASSDGLPGGTEQFRLQLASTGTTGALRHQALADGLGLLYPGQVDVDSVDDTRVTLRATGAAVGLLALLESAPDSVELDEVQPAHEITRTLASGAMSHGALVATAHEAVAHGTNMVGGMSNSGEGGEHHSRYGTIRGSRIKQFASGRFGIWAGYLADPMLEELEIKIGQGAKPGEGGQLPAPKVTVDIAAARGGTPGVELISPPPHHDTYSIEDLAQLIHDCKAARVRVIVKLVSSEGIGTIAVGVAKAGADVINVAGNTGGTGAAAVTSLKYAGRSAEIGVAEVHQALVANGLRSKVTLRCSGAHQTGSDVVTSALLGGDSFEFGTTALMMLGCVMAKNCNVKCPAGLTTNAEAFEGDPRALAQYLLNIAHDVRQILARLGLRSLREARGRTDLLQLLDHPASVGRLDARALLAQVPEKVVTDPEYLEKDFHTDDALLERIRTALVDHAQEHVLVHGVLLGNSDKSVGGQLGIDVERLLNHELRAEDVQGLPAVATDDRGRRRLVDGAVTIRTQGSAGQSYGVFNNDGIVLEHTGTANDGVGKSQSGGRIIVRAPGGGSADQGGNVLIGNFALFGATGGRTFVEGEAGDRFAVRNSGATAVVEGVGDFGCEYMTGGAVFNLGAFGKGLGNGMSGGFLYQYDPSGQVAQRASTDSLLVFPVTDTERGAFHEAGARLLLEWHLEATGSALAERLLADWETTRQHVFVGMPRALLLSQDAGEILAAATRPELLDELATSIATDKLRAFKVDYRDQRTVLDGRAPALGDQGDDMFSLLSSYTVLGVAQDVALERVPGAGPNDPRVTEAVKNLVLTEDFSVKQRVVKYLRGTLDRFADDQLATLIAIKRLDDYKRALTQRNNRSMDAPGTTGWIMHQNAKNDGRVREARFDELLATAALEDIARRAPQAPTEAVSA
ncbi:glutamate synthase large subunit [Curtobacterium flaccumfaciens pv. oortii]|uniref:glutamate synthase-related protein n=1 Tax=Curtobacterium flaccumfaciens TaxID=2035 RepID=UPI001BDF21B2|nr:glutamate synthase-related protein [Curtobacterium flaccumfaciens]MBT1624216.1 glutamate synthase large subunit [Curtobacterium flaccumfaciens pv. oortii]